MKKPLRALVIEDSEFDAALLVNMLRQGGYEVSWRRVDTAEGMRQSLASEDYDIVFSDHEMPQFSAPKALQILQETGHDLPFVIVSGGIGEATAVAAMKAGAHDFVMKGQLGRMLPAVDRELREAQNREARRKAEMSLRESEMRYRLLWESSPDGVVLMDSEGSMRFVNPAVQEIFGYTPEEVLGRHLEILACAPLDPFDLEKHISPWPIMGGLSRRRTVETLGRRKDQTEFEVEIAFSEMEMHGRGWSVAFIRDIAQRKRDERVLRENQEQFQVAREIQQHLFPKNPPQLPGYDIAGASAPAEAAGGDYFDFLPMPNGALGLVVGDVTGHGIGPALLMAETRAYLRIVALNRDLVSEVLTRANRVLAEDVGSERFITALFARLDPGQRLLTYVNAGHPSGFVLDRHGMLRYPLGRSGIPLGMRPDTTYAECPTIALEAGDLVLILTDGFEESMAPDGSFYSMERVLQTVREHRQKPAKEILDALFSAIRDFSGGTPQLDDLTVVVLKVLESC